MCDQDNKSLIKSPPANVLSCNGVFTQCWHFYEKQLPEYNEMIASMATSVTSKTLIVLLVCIEWGTIISLHVQKL